uniref:caspase-8-like n=1 Tax=Myxine glutinosa TaxID=7769 RepID=UPI00358F59ED
MANVLPTAEPESSDKSTEMQSTLRFLCRDEKLSTSDFMKHLGPQTGDISSGDSILNLLQRLHLRGNGEAADNLPSYINPFRLLMFNIYEELTQEEWNNITFLLEKDIPQYQRKIKNFLDLVCVLENEGKLSADNTQIVEECLASIGRQDLRSKLRDNNISSYRRTHCSRGAGASASESQAQNLHPPMRDHFLVAKGFCLMAVNADSLEEQAIRLNTTFQHLKLSVKRHNNLSSTDLCNMGQLYDPNVLAAYDCLVCCILAMGSEKSVLGKDGRSVNTKDIINSFKPINMNFMGKPIMLIIHIVQTPNAEDDDLETDAIPEGPPSILEANMVVCLTREDNSVKHGKKYIYLLTKCLCRFACSKDTVQILVDVNRQFMEEASVGVQTPHLTSTMEKLMYFRKGS